MSRKKNNKTIREGFEREVVDENGEFSHYESKRRYTIEQDDSYIKLYLNEVFRLDGLPASCSEVLFRILGYVTFANDENGKMTVFMNSSLKEDMLENMRKHPDSTVKSISTIDNAITILSKKKILYRLSRAKYQLNPYIFGKGDWKDISELRLTQIWRPYEKEVITQIYKYNRNSIKFFEEESKLFNLYESMLSISNITEKDFDVVLKENNTQPPPNWWYLLQ